MAALVRAGPDPAEHGVVRRRRVELAAVIEARFGVVLAERTVGTLLRRPGFVRLSVRPRHPAQDAAAIPGGASSKPIEFRWQDEARVGQQGILTRVRADKRRRPPASRDQRYRWDHMHGAVCPSQGEGAGLVLPVANGRAMNDHLAETSRQVAPGAHAVVTLDGAGWDRPGGRLSITDTVSLRPLPPYSPERNPVAKVWQIRRRNHLGNRVCETCDARNAVIAAPGRISAIAHRESAAVRGCSRQHA